MNEEKQSRQRSRKGECGEPGDHDFGRADAALFHVSICQSKEDEIKRCHDNRYKEDYEIITRILALQLKLFLLSFVFEHGSKMGKHISNGWVFLTCILVHVFVLMAYVLVLMFLILCF